MDYSTLQRKQLIEICEQRGLPTYGSREQVQARLEKADLNGVTQTGDPMVDVIAALDAGADTDVLSPAQTPPAPVSGPDAQVSALVDAQAEIVALRAQLAAAQSPVPPGPAEPASAAAIRQVVNSERVFRWEFPLHPAQELGDALHQSFIRETAEKAVRAGYVVRGSAHRVGFGVKDGQRTAVYEIYARK